MAGERYLHVWGPSRRGGLVRFPVAWHSTGIAQRGREGLKSVRNTRIHTTDRLTTYQTVCISISNSSMSSRAMRSRRWWS